MAWNLFFATVESRYRSLMLVVVKAHSWSSPMPPSSGTIIRLSFREVEASDFDAPVALFVRMYLVERFISAMATSRQEVNGESREFFGDRVSFLPPRGDGLREYGVGLGQRARSVPALHPRPCSAFDGACCSSVILVARG